MDCREAFENWYSVAEKQFCLQKDNAWFAWQAAWNHPRTTVTSAGEILEDGVLKGEFHG